MKSQPKRTSDSNLSDDELLLFDMLFDGSASASQLSSSVYADHMNCGYNHSLDDSDLAVTIRSLLSRDLIQMVGNSRKSTSPVFSLTKSGGELWQIERRPNWQRFVTISQRELGVFRKGSIVVMCMDETIGRQCLGAMFGAGLVTPIGAILTRSLNVKRLVPWKTFSSVYALRCRTSDNVTRRPNVNWEAYESLRRWWRSIDELITLPI